VAKADLKTENVEALAAGIVNLGAHIENMKKFGVPVVVAINRFGDDSDAELKYIADYCESLGADFALSEVFAKGGQGGVELARKVVAACEKPANFAPVYDTNLSIKEKITAIAKTIYGAEGVAFTADAEKNIKEIEELGQGMPVCIAKTQYSLSDNEKALGRPTGFTVTVREVKISAGAGFIVALTGSIMTMPGLPKVPAANNIDVSDDGKIIGLF
jgi:formate--tetrahydrofolate ligase